MAGQGIRNKEKTHCPAGHEYSPENTMIREHLRKNARGEWVRYKSRYCRKCQNSRSWKSMANSRAEAMKARPCSDCGETGRVKAHVNRGPEHRWFCHDEEKSCYNHRRGNYFEEKEPWQ